MLNVERFESAEADSIDPFHFVRRETASLCLGERATIGPEQPPRVIVAAGSAARLPETLAQIAGPRLQDTPAEGILVEITNAAELASLSAPSAGSSPFLAFELAPAVALADLKNHVARLRPGTLLVRHFGATEAATLAAFAQFAREHRLGLAAEIAPADFAALGETLRQFADTDFIFTLRTRPTSAAHAVGGYRQLTEELRRLGLRAPIWIRNTAATAVRGDNTFLSKLLEASLLTGSLLCDGIGDLVSIETEADAVRATKLAYNVLQGAGARISKTEFVACPSCGRTLFDLQTTTQRIREKTGHLKGVKIAIMGCIVNGPGEMADADFGYVGGAPGKINLYVGKQCVQYNLPQAEADGRLIALIKEHGKWADPAPVPA